MRKAMDIEGNRIDYDPKAKPAPDALLFAHGEYAQALVGATPDGRAVYDLDAMIVWLMRTEGWGYGKALEYVGCGVVGSLPAAGPRGPVLVRL